MDIVAETLLFNEYKFESGLWLYNPKFTGKLLVLVAKVRVPSRLGMLVDVEYKLIITLLLVSGSTFGLISTLYIILGVGVHIPSWYIIVCFRLSIITLYVVPFFCLYI